MEQEIRGSVELRADGLQSVAVVEPDAALRRSGRERQVRGAVVRKVASDRSAPFRTIAVRVECVGEADGDLRGPVRCQSGSSGRSGGSGVTTA